MDSSFVGRRGCLTLLHNPAVRGARRINTSQQLYTAHTMHCSLLLDGMQIKLPSKRTVTCVCIVYIHEEILRFK